MSISLPDRVWEQSSTTGTGNITMGGAVSGFRTFAASLTSGAVVNYVIEGVTVPAEFETGRGTWNGTTLARTRVVTSSNANSLVSFSAGTKNVYLTAAAQPAIQMLASHLYLKAYTGAKGDGVTDDTAAFNTALAAIASNRGDILMIEPGRYMVPNGISETKDNLVVIGLGHCGFGPIDHTIQGVIINATAAGVWTWSKGYSTTNDYYGGRFENICFAGNNLTAGGFKTTMNHVILERCSALLHTTGAGISIECPTSPGTQGGLTRVNNCTTQDCLWGFQCTPGSGAAYTKFQSCIALKGTAGGIKYTGSGFRIFDSGTSIIDCHAESHAIGIDCQQTFGVRIIGGYFEDNSSYDISLNRASGVSGTRNQVIGVSTSKIFVGAFQVGDVIIGGDFNTIVDNGTQTTYIGHEVVKIPVATIGGVPVGGMNGSFSLNADNVLRVRIAGVWRNVNVT